MQCQSKQEHDQAKNEVMENEKNPSLEDKNYKRGIVYISRIPKYMNVSMITEMLSKYGQVERVYLQLDKNPGKQIKIYILPIFLVDSIRCNKFPLSSDST